MGTASHNNYRVSTVYTFIIYKKCEMLILVLMPGVIEENAVCTQNKCSHKWSVRKYLDWTPMDTDAYLEHMECTSWT